MLELPARANRSAGLQNFAHELLKLSRQAGMKMSARGWCVPGDTLILGENEEIANMEALDAAICPEGITTVLGRSERQFDGDIYTVKATGILPFRITGEHPVLVATPKLDSCGRIVGFNTPQWKEPAALCPKKGKRGGDYLVIPKVPGVYDLPAFNLSMFVEPGTDPILTSLPLTADTCWLMGLYVAEGCTDDTQHTITFSLGTHETELVARLTRVIQSLGYGTVVTERTGDHHGATQVRCKAGPLSRAFRQWFGKGALNKRIPEALLLHTNLELVRYFLDGYRDGDGCDIAMPRVNGGSRARTVLVTGSKLLAYQLQLMYARLDIFAKVQLDSQKKPEIMGRPVNVHQYYQISYYPDGKISAKDKVRHVADALYVPVQSVETEPYSGPVYNIETAKHTYLVSNIVVHNCYVLEGFGLINKSQFDRVENIINECRTKGYLPVDFVAEDASRQFHNIRTPETRTYEEYIQAFLRSTLDSGYIYEPEWWENEQYYIQILVEKIDLRTLFLPVCKDYNIPIATAKGWSSILQRAEYARRFKEAEDDGKTCVLLYCGDFDPDGLRIGEFLRSNLEDVANIHWKDGTEGYDPVELIIDRFGLNYDFIIDNDLTWIEGLITGSGKNLASPSHPNFKHAYVQNYLGDYGARKCEANAIVTQTNAGQQLCRDAIEKYLGPDAVDRFRRIRRETVIEFKKYLGRGTELGDVLRKSISDMGGTYDEDDISEPDEDEASDDNAGAEDADDLEDEASEDEEEKE